MAPGGVLTREGKRSPTQAPGRKRYGGTAGRSDKRALSVSPGHSPNSKQSKQAQLSSNSSIDNDEDSTSEEEQPASNMLRTSRAPHTTSEV